MNADLVPETGPLLPDANHIRLIPLNCTRCATPVPAAPDEIGWVCGHCGQGLLLDPDHGLGPLDVQYSAAISSGQSGQPFWAAQGRVTLERDTYGRGQDREARAFWEPPRRFFVPAVDLPLDDLLALGVHLLGNPPDLTPGGPVSFPPVTVPREDVPALAEFIIIAVEAERKDRLKDIRFDLTLDQPELWVLPGSEKAG